MSRLTTRPLIKNDYDQWLPLWNGNNMGVENDDVTATTWRRLMDPNNTQVNGLCAEKNGQLVGITHYILHPTTGMINPVCYMQDVYVDPEHRRQGIGKDLVRAVTKIGEKEQWSRMYWLTQKNNAEAKAMYENFGIKLDFTFYVLPIS